MEVEPPTWLNKEFLTLALQGGEEARPRVEISDYTLKLAVAPGNNYTSYVFRVNVNYKDEGSPDHKTISLIIKAPIEKGVIGEMSDKWDLFSAEPKIYKTVLPMFSEKMKCEFGPTFLSLTEGNGLVLKDLKPDGYVVCDRLKQLDLEHCRKVISCLAKFHAASIASHHEKPDLFESFPEFLYKKDGPMVDQMKGCVEVCFKVFIETSISKGSLKMEQYISERLDKIWDSVVEFCSPKLNRLNVLNHGDCWTNNLLFKYSNNGDIEDVKLIDYQIVRYTSPVLDLQYFIWTSGNEDVRDKHLEELYDIYLETLNQTLKELNCEERMVQEEFNATLNSSSDWILLTIVYTLPFVLCDPDNAIDFGTVSSEEMKDTGIFEMFRRLFSFKGFHALLPGYQRQFETIISSL